LEDADVQEFLNIYALRLTRNELQQLTALSEAEDEENFDHGQKTLALTRVGNPQQTTSVLKTGLHMADGLVGYLFEVDHLMERYLKIKHEIEVVVAPYRIRICRRHLT